MDSALKKYEYFRTPNGVLLHGDCLEIMPMLDKVDLVLTDPPYLLPGMKGAGCFGGRASLTGTKDFTDMGFDSVFLESFTNWFCFCSKHNLCDVISRAKNKWALLHWCKPNPVPTCNGTYLSDVEYCVHSWTSGRLFGKMKDKSLFFNYPCGNKATSHPNEKPIPLIMKLIINGSLLGDTILDPYLGSGTTAVACERLNRRWIGIEISQDFCQIAKTRILKETQQLKMF